MKHRTAVWRADDLPASERRQGRRVVVEVVRTPKLLSSTGRPSKYKTPRDRRDRGGA